MNFFPLPNVNPEKTTKSFLQHLKYRVPLRSSFLFVYRARTDLEMILPEPEIADAAPLRCPDVEHGDAPVLGGDESEVSLWRERGAAEVVPSVGRRAAARRALGAVAAEEEAPRVEGAAAAVAALASAAPDFLYQELERRTGSRQDPCVLDTLRCAVAQARNPRLPKEQRNWWYWSRLRKAGRV